MNGPNILKQIPYGVSDFDYFAAEHYYYVDKTRYLKKIEEKGRYLFFIRPRRFGKSLFLSIMQFYYDINQEDHFDTLFKDTYIQKNPTMGKNQYMVLKLDFSAVKSDSALLETAFFRHVLNAIVDVFLTQYETILGADVAQAKTRFSSLNDASILMDSFLSYLRGKNQKLYLIIDEYDNFANNILASTGEIEYRNITHGQGFFRAFFNVLKSGTSGSGSPISRLFMSGVSPITLDDVTSGFNIGINISLDHDLNEMLGFTRNEVEALIEYYRQTGKINHSTAELLELMGYWYNNYRFSEYADQVVFNSVQVLYFMDQYLKNSKIPKTLIDDNVRIDYQKLRHFIILDQQGKAKTNGNFSMLNEIIKTGSVHATIKSRFSLSELTKPENFASLLFYFGLLTIIGLDEENNAILAIPNETIKRLYYDYIKETYQETGKFSLDLNLYSTLMHDLAFKGNWQPLVDYIANRMAESIGLRDLITGEKVVQAFLNVYLGLSNLYYLHSEKEFNKGFADLVMEPFLTQYPTIQFAYLIEIKYLKASASHPDDSPMPDLKAKINAICTEAENQLRNYALDEKFQKSIGQTKLIKLVLIFCGHRLVHKGEVKLS